MNKPFKKAGGVIEDSINETPAFRESPGAFTALGWFVAGAVVGTAAMFFLDPIEGEKRRNQVRERGIALKNDANQLAHTARSWKDSAQGFVSKISGAFFGRGDEEHSEHLASKADNPSYLH